MKLLASDFDNTILFDNKMNNDDVLAIKEFQKHGHLFGVCTGRSLEGIDKPSQPYHLQYDFYILLSGSLILNKDRKVILEKKIPMNIIKEVCQFLEGIDVSIVNNNQAYKVAYRLEHDNRGIYLQSVDELNAKTVNAFSFHYDEDEINKAKKSTDLINQNFGEYITAFQNNQHIDIVAKGCSKGEGIKLVQEYFHLCDEDIYAIGDSWNDLPMLDATINGYTFQHVNTNIQKHAKKIVKNFLECIHDVEDDV